MSKQMYTIYGSIVTIEPISESFIADSEEEAVEMLKDAFWHVHDIDVDFIKVRDLTDKEAAE